MYPFIFDQDLLSFGILLSVCKLETQRRVIAVAPDVLVAMAVQCQEIHDQVLSGNARSKRSMFSD
jgi:hypothetical protein